MPVNEGNLLVWGYEGVEQNTLSQAHTTSKLPFIEHPLALMPDAHLGRGSTVGSVIATNGAIIPAAIGVDIGCGMIASRTNYKASQLPDSLDELHAKLTVAIPSGVGKGHDRDFSQRVEIRPDWARLENQPERVKNSNKAWNKACSQFGTLGSGNHFVEVCLDEEERVWIVLHSGSRGIGNELARIHIEGAKKLMRQYFITLDDPDLAYFTQGTPEFQNYIHDMLWAQDYAKTSRHQMMHAAMVEMTMFLGHWDGFQQTINCHHNYTEMEHHHGKDVWLTRKGAIRAREGDLGIIPGSMATGTYIVEGLGNPASYDSASHGAGRKMSRSQAKKTFTLDSLKEEMGDRAWNLKESSGLVDEHPGSYKDIDTVMEAQQDLVKVVHRLESVLNMKGT